MKRLNLLLSSLSIIVIFLSCSKDDTLRGSGNIITKGREVNSFAQINNPSSANISITEGTTQSIEVSSDDNVINTLKTTVKNGILNIDLTKANYVDVTINISIVIPNLEGLENTGSGNIAVSGFEDLPSLTIDNRGSGNISLSGSGTLLSLKNSGSGSYEGFGFEVNNCTVSNSGSGTCEINCTYALSGSNSGSGSVFYKGNPSSDITNTGSGEIVDSN